MLNDIASALLVLHMIRERVNNIHTMTKRLIRCFAAIIALYDRFHISSFCACYKMNAAYRLRREPRSSAPVEIGELPSAYHASNFSLH